MECIRVNGDLFDSSDTWTMGLPSCDVHWVIYIYIIIFVCFHYLWWHLHMFQASKINQMQEYNMCHKRDGWYLYGVLTSPNYQVVVSVFFLKVRCCLGNMSPFWQTYFSNRRWLNNRLYKINHLVKEIADVRPKRLWIQRTRIGLGPLALYICSNPHWRFGIPQIHWDIQQKWGFQDTPTDYLFFLRGLQRIIEQMLDGKHF